MTNILYGKPVVDAIKTKFIIERDFLLSKAIYPQIAIVRVGNKKNDIAYENRIEKNCFELGVKIIKNEVDDNITTGNLVNVISKLNSDNNTHGILIFRPLPEKIDMNIIRNSIDPNKDIDSMTGINAEKIFQSDKTALAPCTPLAVIELLEFYGYELAASNIGIINRSLVLGKPLTMLLLEKNATVTIGHSKTKDLKNLAKSAEIIITGIGKAKYFNQDYFNQDSIVIDVGINFDENGICGDVDYESVSTKVKAISPVPGGIGTVTSMMLFMNLLKAIKLQFE